jgi:hypothetical protein
MNPNCPHRLFPCHNAGRIPHLPDDATEEQQQKREISVRAHAYALRHHGIRYANSCEESPAPEDDFFCAPARASDSEVFALKLKRSSVSCAPSQFPNIVAVLADNHKSVWFGLVLKPKAIIRKKDKFQVHWFKRDWQSKTCFVLAMKNNWEPFTGEVCGDQVLDTLTAATDVVSFFIHKKVMDGILAKAFV